MDENFVEHVWILFYQNKNHYLFHIVISRWQSLLLIASCKFLYDFLLAWIILLAVALLCLNPWKHPYSMTGQESALFHFWNFFMHLLHLFRFLPFFSSTLQQMGDFITNFISSYYHAFRCRSFWCWSQRCGLFSGKYNKGTWQSNILWSVWPP